jgi:hypothetical protein
MANFLVYSLSTGIIDRTGSVPDGQELLQALPGEGAMLNPSNFNGADYSVSLGPPPTLVAKAAMGAVIDKLHIAANGVAQAIISSVPVGADLYINGTYNQNVSDGTVEFSSAVSGIYILELRESRHLTQQFRVTVGISEMVVGGEVESGGPSVAFPVPYGAEIESGGPTIDAMKIAVLTVGGEVEVDTLAIVGVKSTELDAGGEIETVGPTVAFPLPLGGEVEGGGDLAAEKVMILPVGGEIEGGFDAVAA